MILLPGLCFYRHTVGRWEQIHFAWPGWKKRPVSQRRHVLAFTCDELDIDCFSPVGKVNDDLFLGAGPGRVLCADVQVSKATFPHPVNGWPHPTLDEMSEERVTGEPVWLLEYQLMENAAQAWNQASAPVERPAACQSAQFPPFAMHLFFGPQNR